MSTTTEPNRQRDRLAPIVCEPWCKDRGTDREGHPGEFFRADQWCNTDERETVLTREYRHPDHRSEVDTMAVSVQRFPGRVPEVALRHTAPDDLAHLSPEEAREVAAALIAAADLVEGIA